MFQHVWETERAEWFNNLIGEYDVEEELKDGQEREELKGLCEGIIDG